MKNVSKPIGIVLSILFVICGILFWTMPGIMLVFNVWFILAALVVNGIYKLVTYFVNKEGRNGWRLADGIISTLLGVLILVDILVTPVATTIGIIGSLGFILGFYEMFIGCNQLCSIGAAKKNGQSGGWLIFLGILNIICGMFIMMHPIISTIAVEWISGIYLVIFGVTTLISSIFD